MCILSMYPHGRDVPAQQLLLARYQKSKCRCIMHYEIYLCSTYVRTPSQTLECAPPNLLFSYCSSGAWMLLSSTPTYTNVHWFLKYSTSNTANFHVFTIMLRKDSHMLSIEAYSTLLACTWFTMVSACKCVHPQESSYDIFGTSYVANAAVYICKFATEVSQSPKGLYSV